MTTLAHVDDILELLREVISKNHPLYERKVFPFAFKGRGRFVIFETDDNDVEEYYIVDFGSGVTRKKKPPTELIEGRATLQERMDLEEVEYIASLPVEDWLTDERRLVYRVYDDTIQVAQARCQLLNWPKSLHDEVNRWKPKKGGLRDSKNR